LRRSVSYKESIPRLIPNISIYDYMIVNQQTESLIIDNPAGMPVDGQTLIFRLRGTAIRTVSWGTDYVTVGEPIPTELHTNVTYIGFLYAEYSGQWHGVAVSKNWS